MGLEMINKSNRARIESSVIKTLMMVKKTCSIMTVSSPVPKHHTLSLLMGCHLPQNLQHRCVNNNLKT